MTNRDDYDGPPAWWIARQRWLQARRPMCDEYGTPRYEGEADDEDTDTQEEGEE